MTFRECQLCDQQVEFCLTDRRKPEAKVLLCGEHYAEIGVKYRLQAEGRLIDTSPRRGHKRR